MLPGGVICAIAKLPINSLELSYLITSVSIEVFFVFHSLDLGSLPLPHNQQATQAVTIRPCEFASEQ
jgi:hypothetical protein